MGMPTQSPPLNFLFQSFLFLGKNMVGSLNNIPFSPIPSSTFFPSPSEPPLEKLSLAHCLVLTPSSPSSTSQDSSLLSEKSIVHYQLRNCHIPVVGDLNHKLEGLGLNPFPSSFNKGRGRKYFLSKVQVRVVMDMEV
jgi:hypothetical protein